MGVGVYITGGVGYICSFLACYSSRLFPGVRALPMTSRVAVLSLPLVAYINSDASHHHARGTAVYVGFATVSGLPPDPACDFVFILGDSRV